MLTQKPINTYNQFAKKQTRLLEENKNALRQIAYNKNSNGKNTYVIEHFTNGKIQITNANAKTPIKKREEITKIHRIIEEAEKHLPKENHKKVAEKTTIASKPEEKSAMVKSANGPNSSKSQSNEKD